MSPALEADGLRPTMSRVAVGCPARASRPCRHFPSSVRRAVRFGRLGGGPARLRGGSSAWHAGLTGWPGAQGRSGDGSRRAAFEPGRVRRPGWLPATPVCDC